MTTTTKKEESKEKVPTTFPQIISHAGGIHSIFTKEKGTFMFISPGNPSLEDLELVADFLLATIKKSIVQRDMLEKEEFKKVDGEKKVPIETK